MFKVQDLVSSDIAILKLNFLPHQAGINAAKAVFFSNRNFEHLIGTDVRSFIEESQKRWFLMRYQEYIQDQEESAFSVLPPKYTQPPIFWMLYSQSSMERVLKFNFEAWFGRELSYFEVLDIITISHHSISCAVFHKFKFYPIVHLPETLTIAFRPHVPLESPLDYPHFFSFQ